MSFENDILDRAVLPARTTKPPLLGREAQPPAEFAASRRPERPVFFTNSRLREYAFRITCLTIFAFALVSIAVIAARTFYPPDLSASYTGVIQTLDAQDGGLKDLAPPSAQTSAEPDAAGAQPEKPEQLVPEARRDDVPAPARASWADPAHPPRLARAGFSSEAASTATEWLGHLVATPPPQAKTFIFVQDVDQRAAYSLGRNQALIDYLLPAWLHLNALGALSAEPLENREQVGDALQRSGHQPQIIPTIDNLGPDGFQLSGVRRLTDGDAALRQRFVQRLLALLQQIGAAGVGVDFRGLQRDDVAALGGFLSWLAPQLRAEGFLLVVRAPLADDGVWRSATAAADYVILADRDYAVERADIVPEDRSARIEAALAAWARSRPDGLVAEVPGPSYQITNGSRNARILSFDEAMQALDRSAKRTIAHPGGALGNFQFSDEQGRVQRIFVQDAATFFNLYRLMQKAGVTNAALRNIGGEDPALWLLLDRLRRGEQISASLLDALEFAYPFKIVGSGEVFSVEGEAKPGSRAAATSDAGAIESEVLKALPVSRELRRWGDKFPNRVALTFDDGPDPRYTPAILDVLKHYDVPGAFFVVGSNALLYPKLVRRMYEEGHEIGNHTFSHPDLSRISDLQMNVELSGTQRVLESTIGRDTLLFRAPYAADESGTGYGQSEVAAKASKLGYVMVDMYVDPLDWYISDSEEIADRVVRAVESGAGHVILLHDAGGDRSGTIAALPKIITTLRAKGYQFATLGELVGLRSDAFMPPVKGDASPLRIQNTGISVFGTVLGWLTTLLFVAIFLGLARVAIIMLLAGLPRRRRRLFGSTEAPLVSVIIPAYNEEKVVVETVNSIRRSDYPNLEIVVVDDGSTDATLEVLRRAFTGTEVRLLSKPNGGKASALNLGIKATRGAFIIALDADTIYRPDTIPALIRHFADPAVGAVAGNAKVGNRRNVLTQLQALEYVTAQNLDRRAFEIIGGITVVPGAVGAWRRAAVEQAGGYSGETVAEDADLTISLLRHGWKIVYAPDSIAYTEAPETLGALVRQRYRWAFGTLQNVWKHRRAFIEPRSRGLCFVAFPHMALFQFILPVLAPVADAMFVAGLIGLGLHKWFHPDLQIGTDARILLQSYLIFSLVDAAAAVAAFIAERREDPRLLLLIPLQRIMYRQILYFVLVKAIAGAIKGQLARWDKLERTATVSAS